MKKLITILITLAMIGCSATPNIPRIVCDEKTVGVVVGNRVCWPVGFGVYAWQNADRAVSPIELFYFDSRMGRGR